MHWWNSKIACKLMSEEGIRLCTRSLWHSRRDLIIIDFSDHRDHPTLDLACSRIYTPFQWPRWAILIMGKWKKNPPSGQCVNCWTGWNILEHNIFSRANSIHLLETVPPEAHHHFSDFGDSKNGAKRNKTLGIQGLKKEVGKYTFFHCPDTPPWGKFLECWECFQWDPRP